MDAMGGRLSFFFPSGAVAPGCCSRSRRRFYTHAHVAKGKASSTQCIIRESLWCEVGRGMLRFWENLKQEWQIWSKDIAYKNKDLKEEILETCLNEVKFEMKIKKIDKISTLATIQLVKQYNSPLISKRVPSGDWLSVSSVSGIPGCCVLN